MDLEKTIKVLEEIEYELDNLIWNESICSNENIKALNVAIETLKKYRWHDLRKNPADLPEDNKDVLVTIKGGCVNRTWHDSCGWRNATAKKARYYSNDRVIAWKEIEEFENEEI